jgi:NAD(P)-dependent dehydrogenase (short-subunit alcohol dehydrogenase family)
MSSPSKVVLVTGASSGIGRATAERFAADGHTVFGTSREPHPVGAVRMLRLDVSDDASVRACVDEVLAAAGRLDVLVSNAGQMVFGPIEEVPLDSARRMFDVNFWGAARVVAAALPSLRASRGHAVLVGSVAGSVAVPLNGFYAASKAALGRYAEALRHETAHLGVRVSLIEPADFRTAFWTNAEVVPATIGAYRPVRERVLRALRILVDAAPAPTPVAEAVVRIASLERPPPVVRVGTMARRLPALRALLPAMVFEAGVRRRFGLTGM